MALPTVAVIGAGNVGCALAGDLVLRGADVRLCNRSARRLDPIREAGGLTVTGEVDGFAPLDRLTDSVEDAVAGADIVAITVPTPALPFYAPLLADSTTADHSSGSIPATAAGPCISPPSSAGGPVCRVGGYASCRPPPTGAG